jgi:hypothetical protein
MKLVVTSLVLAFSLISLPPALAQGRGGGSGGGGTQADIAALEARIAKLEGNIVAADLAGTYSVIGYSTDMKGFRAGPPAQNATISTSTFRATLTLTADGNGRIGGPGSCEGATLTPSTGSMNGEACEVSGETSDVTWTYTDGVVTVTFLEDGDQLPFNVALGGRFLIIAFSPFHAGDPSSDHALIVATRLK